MTRKLAGRQSAASSSTGLLDGLGRLKLLCLAEGGTDVDVAGDLHCLQERTGFTTCVLLGVQVETGKGRAWRRLLFISSTGGPNRER